MLWYLRFRRLPVADRGRILKEVLIYMDALQLFEYEDHRVRVVKGEDGEPWFVAADVAEVLGYANSRKAVADHCKGVTKRDTLTDGGYGVHTRDRTERRSSLPVPLGCGG